MNTKNCSMLRNGPVFWSTPKCCWQSERKLEIHTLTSFHSPSFCLLPLIIFSSLSLSLTHTHSHTTHTHTLSLFLSHSSSSSPTLILSPSLNALFIILPLSSHRKWMGYILSSVPDIPDIFLYLRNQYTKNHVRFLTNVNAYLPFDKISRKPK